MKTAFVLFLALTSSSFANDQDCVNGAGGRGMRPEVSTKTETPATSSLPTSRWKEPTEEVAQFFGVEKEAVNMALIRSMCGFAGCSYTFLATAVTQYRYPMATIRGALVVSAPLEGVSIREVDMMGLDQALEQLTK